ncbi:MT-A70 family methyltransferase [Acidovorax sp.]|uniref:MT-A70 family methyltransferase n=1 Tax=Acidovorax sp. TaxID=1872122 RepID=UPI0026148832|nr:MT-A70 family methyltransferase [Acidovorax sp.]HQS22695.1 MT-A70 family methyltransferase [Acidovorax defluvii]HQT19530.1 MT-A70 family methyltransferase [Acidovorax defluvii]HQT51154.1 MT-A70 family methyltransferase [Acidovorax defluvii]
MHNILIDSEFQALIPPLSAEERAQLEANLLADGCRDPLVVWETAAGENILIDGHNRHEICTRLGLPFEVVAQEFDSRAHARIWMRANQAGRRNLPDAWKIDLQLGNKDDLAAIGKAKIAQSNTERASKDESHVIQMDKVEQPKHNTQKEIAKAADVGVGTVARAEIVKRKAPDLWEKAKAQEITIGAAYTQVKRAEKEEKREERREENRAKVAEVVAPAQIVEAGARFATIVIDPPWDWGDEGDQDQLGRARPDYATMTMAQLLDLPVADMSDEDCHIYLWITNRSLPKGFELLERWGFRYITALTWAKPHFGMGNYFRGQTEHVLFGVRGSQPLKRRDVGTVFHAPRGPAGHSSKPPEIYDLVESCSPGPYLEMFSRSQRADWTSWGENANARA